MFLASILLFTACSSDDDKTEDEVSIVGIWEYTNGDQFARIIFNENGTGHELYLWQGNVDFESDFTYKYNSKTMVLTICENGEEGSVQLKALTQTTLIIELNDTDKQGNKIFRTYTRKDKASGNGGNNNITNNINSNNNQGYSAKTGTINGHDYVDLGLPSGTKWATCNVGASKPEEYGGHYAWGETTTKNEYSWATYKYGTSIGDTKNIGSNISGTSYDVVHVKWGDSWCIPTIEQWKELVNNTYSSGYLLNGVGGRKFESKINGESIFIPTAGYYSSSGLVAQGGVGNYWSSTLLVQYPFRAFTIEFNQGSIIDIMEVHRCNGLSIRPVTKNSGGSNGGGSSESGEAPSFRDFTWTYTNTSVIVQYLTTDNNTTKATVYYGKSASPSTPVATTVSGGHIISARITGLTKATKYYVKCVATNEYGSTTSDVMPVMTGSD